MLFLISLSVCFCNVVGEALMVELAGAKHNQDSQSNVALFFGSKAVGGLLSAYFSGYLLQYLTKR
jgi:hypothetical protein